MAVPASPSGMPTALPISDAMLSQLAHECAREIYPLADILRSYRLDPAYFQGHVVNHPRFMMYYSEAHALWNSSANTRERSALKAAVMFEQWLEQANTMFMNDKEPLSSRVSLMQYLGKVAKVVDDAKEAGATQGDRVVVNINLGAGRNITIDKHIARDVTSEGQVIEGPK